MLGFDEGEGYFDLEEGTKEPNLAQCGWIDQARTIGAHSLFFVKDYPTVVFFKLDRSPTIDTSAVEEDIRRLHMKVWNTSLIPIFFFALPGEIRVYSAHQKPARDVDEWRSNNKWIQQLKMITEVAEVAQLTDFSREQIESGNVFAGREDQFNRESRVDQWLLKNLRMLNLKMAGTDKKKAKHAHALIGRSIFIRYLEDRGVLVKSYFSDLSISRNGNYERYTDVLSNKVDTYNLFEKLRADFNGDLFQLTTDEEENIDQLDLNSIVTLKADFRNRFT